MLRNLMFEGLGPYLGVLIWLWVASVGVPVPEDIALLTGGFLCYQGKAALVYMILVSLFGVLSGDMLIYYLGHRWSSDLLDHRLTRRMATPERIESLKIQFHNHQHKTIFVARFMPGMRALVFLVAGAVKISVWRFLLMDGFAAIISVPFFVVLGYVFGQSFETLKANVEYVKHFAIVLVIVALAGWFLWHTYSKKAKTREAKWLLSGFPNPPSNPPADSSKQ